MTSSAKNSAPGATGMDEPSGPIPTKLATMNERRKRLRERYSCSVKDHDICFVGQDGKHTHLTGTDIDIWLDAWYISQANLLCPPPSILLLAADTSDNSSIRSRSTAFFSVKSSRSANQVHRIREARNLADWRSIQETFQTSSSLHTGEFSPGHFTGRAINFLGLKFLKPVIYVQIRLHLRKAARRIKTMDLLEPDDRVKYLDRKADKLLLSAQDLLELNNSKYTKKLQTSAMSLGSALKRSLKGVPKRSEILDTKFNMILISFELQALSSDRDATPFMEDLGNVLLQDTIETPTYDFFIDAIDYIGTALLYGRQSDAWQFNAYFVLRAFAGTNIGLDVMQHLDERGSLITDVVRHTLESPPFNREAHCVAFGFMMQVSVRLLNLQQYMIEPNGIPFVLHTLESLSSEYDNCKDELSRDSTQAQITEWWYNVKKAAQYPWNSKLLLQCDFAAFLNRLRIGPIHTTITQDVAEASYNQIYVFNSITKYLGLAGIEAVKTAAGGQAAALVDALMHNVKNGPLPGPTLRQTQIWVNEIHACLNKQSNINVA